MSRNEEKNAAIQTDEKSGEAHTASRMPAKRKRKHRCKGRGYEIHPSCDYCGECRRMSV